MKGQIKINNAPPRTEEYIVCRVIRGEAWFWGSWKSKEKAYMAANELGGIVVRAEK